MSKERRRFDRASQSVEVQYRRRSDLPQPWEEGLMLNLSAAGIRLQLRGCADPGTILEVQIKLPNNRNPVALCGRVVWRAPPNASICGIELLDVTPDQRADIDELVQFLNKHY